jgi:hypothetical protein
MRNASCNIESRNRGSASIYIARWLVIDRYPDVVAIQARASSLKFPERGKALRTRGFAALEPPKPPNRHKTKLNCIQPIENKEWASLQIAAKIHFSRMRYLHSGSPRFGLETGQTAKARIQASGTRQSLRKRRLSLRCFGILLDTRNDSRKLATATKHYATHFLLDTKSHVSEVRCLHSVVRGLDSKPGNG